MNEKLSLASIDDNEHEKRSTEYAASLSIEEGLAPVSVREIMKKNTKLFQSGVLKEGIVRDILTKEAKMLESTGLSKEESNVELQRVFNNMLPKS